MGTLTDNHSGASFGKSAVTGKSLFSFGWLDGFQHIRWLGRSHYPIFPPPGSNSSIDENILGKGRKRTKRRKMAEGDFLRLGRSGDRTCTRLFSFPSCSWGPGDGRTEVGIPHPILPILSSGDTDRKERKTYSRSPTPAPQSAPLLYSHKKSYGRLPKLCAVKRVKEGKKTVGRRKRE